MGRSVLVEAGALLRHLPAVDPADQHTDEPYCEAGRHGSLSHFIEIL
jgi:hypothetical protein